MPMTIMIFQRLQEQQKQIKFTDLTDLSQKCKGKFWVENKVFNRKELYKTQYMEHYFRENEALIFNRHDEDQVKIEFHRFVERTKGEIQAWPKKGSGWALERIMAVYVNVRKYQPAHGRPKGQLYRDDRTAQNPGILLGYAERQ